MPVRFGLLLRLLPAVTVSWAMAAAQPASSDDARPDVPHVLLLYPYDNLHAASMETGGAARLKLMELADGKVDFYMDFLDFLRFPVDTDSTRVAETLSRKYRDSRIDLILTFNSESYRFAIRHRDDFAPGVPAVFCCVTEEHLLNYGTVPDFPGIVIDYDLHRTMDLILALQPDVKELVVIGGAGEIDRAWTKIYREQLAAYEGAPPITYLEGLKHEELLARVAQLPERTAILLGVLFTDGDGRRRAAYENAQEIAAAASAPAYAPIDTYFGRGIVGGHIGTYEDAGNEMAEMAWQMLGGADPATIARRASTAQRMRIDARAMEHFGLSTASLPQDALLLYRVPTIWEQHRALVIVAASVIAVQATLILALMLQTARRRRAEENARVAHVELAHVSRVTTMGELTASIAHEVNQPLTAIVANGNAALRWLGHATPDLSEARDALVGIVQDGLRAANVISAIRGMVRRSEPNSQSLDMGTLVREVLGLLRTEIESNGVTQTRDIAEDLPTVSGDRVQLQQVVLNLVMNAIEAMAGQPAGERRLRVDVTRSRADHIAVGVSDTGPGIPAEAAERVFEPFYTTKSHGMGMGLSICRTIVEAHGGKLSLEPNSPHGTTFIVTLPTERSTT